MQSRKKKKIDPRIPQSFSDACQHEGWCKAIDCEYNALVNRGTCTYIKPPHGIKPVLYTWVFKLKPLDAVCQDFMEKARCCVHGDQNVAYIDYDPENIYAPVAGHDSIRMLIATAASNVNLIEVADISNAYLYGKLDIPIYTMQPTDSTRQQAKPGHICLLQKSMYVSKQACEIRGSLLDKSLKNWSFSSSRYDHCIYFYNQGTEFITIAIFIHLTHQDSCTTSRAFFLRASTLSFLESSSLSWGRTLPTKKIPSY